MHIDANTRLVTLLGHPVEHSLSPRIHNGAFRQQNVNAVYVATPVRPGDVEAAVDGLRALHLLGANVTVPHKEAVLPFLDDATDRAAATGAVNTIVREERDEGTDLLRGDNTDVDGFLAPLRERASGKLTGRRMLVFGGGGGARAVAFSLLTEYGPDRLTIVARRPEQAEQLAEDLAKYDEKAGLAVSTFEAAADAVRRARLLVNATPVGMAPKTDATPWADAEDFDSEQVVYDLVYTPEKTRFLRDASERGAATIGGLQMLVEQAAAAYAQWTGREMPREVVYEVLRS